MFLLYKVMCVLNTSSDIKDVNVLLFTVPFFHQIYGGFLMFKHPKCKKKDYEILVNFQMTHCINFIHTNNSWTNNFESSATLVLFYKIFYFCFKWSTNYYLIWFNFQPIKYALWLSAFLFIPAFYLPFKLAICLERMTFI